MRIAYVHNGKHTTCLRSPPLCRFVALTKLFDDVNSCDSKTPPQCQCGMTLSGHHVTEAVVLPDDDDLGELLTDELQNQRRQLAVNMIAKKMMSLQQQQPRWDPELHTVEREPDSYGTIHFDGFGQVASKRAPVSMKR